MRNTQLSTNSGSIFLRGLLVGGSIGMIAGWFGYEPSKAFFLGILCGLLAAGTRVLVRHLQKTKDRTL